MDRCCGCVQRLIFAATPRAPLRSDGNVQALAVIAGAEAWSVLPFIGMAGLVRVAAFLARVLCALGMVMAIGPNAPGVSTLAGHQAEKQGA